MRPDDVRTLYDEDTARTYNERWHGAPWGNDTQHLAEAIGRRVHPGIRWLDVGCGTGHFLSRFPGIDRAGTDLSPSMLGEARSASPDASFFEEWDFRNDNPEWHDGFTLVTCTGEPWSYVETIEETEQVVSNLARWTAHGGTCLLAIQDPLDLTGMHLPYYIPTEPGMPGEITVKALVWSLTDRSHDHIPEIGTKRHHNMVWPLLEHWVATFGQHFLTIIIETLPHDPPWLNTPRRVLIAKDKRSPGDTTPVNVVHTSAGTPYHEMIEPDPVPASESGPMAAPTATAERVAEPIPPTAPVVDSPHSASAEPFTPVPLRDQSINALARKFRPWRPNFWRSALRRLVR